MSVATRMLDDVFFFGSPEQQLLGVLHEPQTYAIREYGVVICYPFGHEYVRSHRACRQLAIRLSQEGFPVLRFDYSGTGDSFGVGEEANLTVWRDDIAKAVDTLRERTGAESICLAGLRLGASLAYDVARSRNDVTSLILWEPIVRGSDYITELSEVHQELLWRFFDDAHKLAASRANEFMGFPMSQQLRSELESMDLLEKAVPAIDNAYVVEGARTPGIVHLHGQLANVGVEARYEEIAGYTIWRENVDKGLVPEEVLQGIVSWASEVLP